ncbi:hypothetical protein Bca4012_083953 [Brassica carinata]
MIIINVVDPSVTVLCCELSKLCHYHIENIAHSMIPPRGFSTEQNSLLFSFISIFDGPFSVTTGFVSITPTVTRLCLLHPPLELTFVYVFLDKPESISPHSLPASCCNLI